MYVGQTFPADAQGPGMPEGAEIAANERGSLPVGYLVSSLHASVSPQRKSGARNQMPEGWQGLSGPLGHQR